jgi:integrase
VSLNGREFYLGPHNSPESKIEYERLVSEWQLAGRQHPEAVGADDGGATIDQVIEAYLEHVKVYYRKHGEPTTSQQHIHDALAPLHEMYGTTPTAEFGPLALKALRQQLIDEGRWSRNTINKQIGIIKRMFKWGVENELVPPRIFQGLHAITGLKRGRTEARETTPVKPVPEAHVDSVLDHVPPPVGAMIELQRLTGMRPGEVVIMRGCDLDTTGKLWTYTPTTHKTEHHGQGRVVYFGPKAQEILSGWLKPDLQAFLFSPAEAEQARNASRRAARRTPMTPSQAKRGKRGRRSRPPRSRYTQATYRRAIHRACDTAFPPPHHLSRQQVRRQTGVAWESKKEWRERLGEEAWEELLRWRREHRWSPNQLRHNAATYLRKQFGIEAARVVLGHSSAAVTEVYAELDLAKAADIMARVG